MSIEMTLQYLSFCLLDAGDIFLIKLSNENFKYFGFIYVLKVSIQATQF